MLDRYFKGASTLDRLRRGALGTVLDDFACRLHDEGYSEAVSISYLSIGGHFSDWLTLEGIAPTRLSPETMARFHSS